MKMRASLAKAVVFGMAAVCVTAIVLLIASHIGKIASRQTGAAKALAAANNTAKPASAKADPKWAEAYGKLPMGFEENKGQTNSDVRFLSHGQGYELFLTSQEAVLELRHSKPADLSPMKRSAALKALHEGKDKPTISLVRMRLAGSNPAPEMAGLNRLPGKTNYFVGSNPKNWRTDIPSYGRVKYTDVYPGIDLVFYGNRQQLEYDFVVAPGSDPKAIALDVTGARKLHINTQGSLSLTVPGGEVVLQRPVVYQEVNGERREIPANYAVSGNNRVNFSVGNYDESKPLVVDPVLNYATYLGGSASGDLAYGIAVDAVGDAYVAGETFSSSFPTTGAGAFDSTAPGGIASGAVFVTELNSTGTVELYSTYLGGSSGEVAFGIAVDNATPNSVYVTGETFSIDYPTTANAYIPGPLATNPFGSAFISKITPTLVGINSLIYSSYVGGTNGDFGNAIAADSSQNAYITGVTISAGISTANAFETTGNDPVDGNAFLTRIDTTQSGAASLIYSTYLGGSGANVLNAIPWADAGFGVAVGSSKAYVTGVTSSTDFPTSASAYQSSPKAGNTEGAAFVSEIDTTQSGANSLVYSTYLSGEVFDVGNAIALGQNGVAYATGTTDSLQFPITAGAFQTTGASTGVVFVTLIDTTKSGASSLKYSTFLGGNDSDTGYGIQVDSAGNAYVAGGTDSLTPPGEFPLTPGALQTSSTNTQGNAFVSEINPGGNGAADLIYSTIFGGSGNTVTPDRAYGIALDSANNVYIGGQTASTDFPAYPKPGAFQTSLTGSDAGSVASAFVAKLTLEPTVTVTPTTLAFGTLLDGTTSAAQFVTVTNNTGIVVPYSLTLQGTNPGDFVAAPGGAAPCAVGTLALNNTPCTISVTFTPSIVGAESANLIVGYSPYGIASSQTVTLTGTGTNTSLTVAPGVLNFNGQLVTTTSATQPVTVTNSSVSSGAVSLTNATDFSITVAAGDPAGCTLTTAPANTTCTYNVAFNPATGDTGALTSTFSVTAGANTQSATLNGTGWDFNFTPSTQTVTTAPGATISPAPTVTANFLGGFTGPVTLSCTGTIPLGSCTVPASVSASGAVTVTIMTTGSSVAPPSSFRFPPVSRRQVVLIGFSVLLLFTLPFARRRRSKVGLVGALVMIIGLTACSGSAGTPANSYNLTISGTSNGVMRSATITLKVT